MRCLEHQYDRGFNDAGTVSFEATNDWLRKQGFKEKVLVDQRDWTIHQFDKTFTRVDGTKIPIRVARFLGEAELEEPRSVTSSTPAQAIRVQRDALTLVQLIARGDPAIERCRWIDDGAGA